MKPFLVAIALLTPALFVQPLSEAEDIVARLDALRDDLTPLGAYAYARGLVDLPASGSAPPVDARVYLASLAPAADLSALDALAPGGYAALSGALAAHAAAGRALGDMGAMEAARAALLAGIDGLAAIAPVEGEPVLACGALYLHLGSAPQTIPCDVAISIAGFGDDVYLNRAGGAGPNEAALAIDLGGDDVRVLNLSVRTGVNGGALGGWGALVDLAGDDVYDATLYDPSGRFPGYIDGSINGGGRIRGGPGVGLLVDLAGDDRYRGRLGTGGVNGGASFAGSGALIDLAGEAESFDGLVSGLTGGVNGGANDGFGLFFHCGRAATYDGYVQERGGVNSGGEQSVSVFVACGGDGARYLGYAGGGGVNAGSSGDAQSVFVHLEGDALFSGRARYGGVNGGSYIGDSLLVSGRGSQRYEALIDDYGGANGGAIFGTGTLVDLDGDDTYVARAPRTVGANGAALLGGIGLLLDARGDDAYDADVEGGPASIVIVSIDDVATVPLHDRAVNGEGGAGGCGALVDLGGSDRYRDSADSVWVHDDSAVARGTPCSVRLDTVSG